MSQLRDRSARGLTLVKAEVTENTSGWKAVDYKVIVKRDAVQKHSGMIEVPEETRKLERWTVPTATLVDAGEKAFTDGRRADGEFYHWGRKPVLGTRVLIKEFEGTEFEGDDGETYVLLADNDIGAIHE